MTGRLALCAVLAAIAAPVAAQQSETLSIPSRKMSDEAFLAADADAGEPVTISGRLTLPGDAPSYPAVVLLHGTDGKQSGASYTWESYLPTVGVATLALDSYTGRGLQFVSFDQEAFGQFPQTYDAFRAVEALAAHPRIDPDRIAVMGFSRGANAALFTAMTRFQETFGPQGATIAAHFAFYPACNIKLARETDVGPAPIRIFTGAADDWTPPAACSALAGRLTLDGRDARFVEYPGARHGFDNEFAVDLLVEGGAMSSRNCSRVEVDGRLVNADTGEPFSYADACVVRGASVQYDPDAAAAARTDVTTLLADLFDLN